MENGKGVGGNMNWANILAGQHDKNEAGKTPEGEGWQTFWEILEDSPYGQTKTRKLIRDRMDSGEIEQFKGTEVKEGTSLRRIWYRPKVLAKV